MNFWKRYPGDYARDTSHLDLTEHGIYTLLLDYLYTTEKEIPLDLKQIYRILRAQKTSEKRKIGLILNQFFIKNSSGYTHKRAEKEIHIAEQKRAVNRLNGSKGGRPANPDTNPEDNPEITQTVSQKVTQKKGIPDTRHQKEQTLSDLQSNFECLWGFFSIEFGQKGSKKKALAEFQKLKPDSDLFSSMIESLNNQIKFRVGKKSSGDFWERFPHVERWLRDRRWEDELEPAPEDYRGNEI